MPGTLKVYHLAEGRNPLDAKAAWLRTPVYFSYWLPPLLWCTVVLLFSGDWGSSGHTLGLLRWLLSWIPFFSPAQIMAIHSYLRKSAHVLAYGILCFLWLRAFQGHLYYRVQKAAVWSLGLSLLVALVDEGHQAMITSRSGRLQDVGLDFSAALLAALLIAIFWRPRPRPKPGPPQPASQRQSP
jgi:VanZ family protein